MHYRKSFGVRSTNHERSGWVLAFAFPKGDGPVALQGFTEIRGGNLDEDGHGYTHRCF